MIDLLMHFFMFDFSLQKMNILTNVQITRIYHQQVNLYFKNLINFEFMLI